MSDNPMSDAEEALMWELENHLGPAVDTPEGSIRRQLDTAVRAAYRRGVVSELRKFDQSVKWVWQADDIHAKLHARIAELEDTDGS